ncbi:4-hydroxyphenylpyruvate dioxygenase [Catenulispora acidiphila DSM 44928]|uniref:4-hydroxyphenylpyruvate dioxygenase n=1 Tax=Catenulispora acidiphila (strain DSM 44928 / JCM 14897 / NBRC 102108 / NRRL B-24433 / ID139908) TaxID=479433 RepID=C7Q7H0_CATAD|nr:4-hydroxyphenylpyruvate dioxygenase [Catenulispora acidiphila]ACU72163.1 4-hydroxyphenylpyruvate dioxygenase [Catenulispora acidiphila DSM 44928]
MDILGIDHVEFYVGDARQAAFFLCTAFGFHIAGHGGPETELPRQRSLLLAHGDSRVLLTSALSSGHPADGYVSRHGDGVGVIAFATVDATGAYEEAVAAGATAVEAPRTYKADGDTVTTASVGGFGDVVHRFVERRGAAFWPGAIEPQPAPARTEPELVRAIDHAAVLVPDGELEPTVEYYQRVFGFKLIFEEYVEVGAQGMYSQVVQSPSGGATFTIIQPDMSRDSGQIDDFLAWHGGAGVQHLALSTDDIVATVKSFAANGAGFAQTPGAYYDVLPERIGATDLPVDQLRPLGILVDRDHWGQMYQIFSKSMHIRRTFFWELIERHGAKTFGTSNIPALYAAKERELAGVRDSVDVGAMGTAGQR